MWLYNLPLIVEANISIINLSSVLFYLHWLTRITISFFVDVGCQGRISDGGVFKNGMLHKKNRIEKYVFTTTKAFAGKK